MEINSVDIVLVEDNMDDAALTIRSLKKSNLCNNLLHLKDGEEALEYFFNEDLVRYPKLVLLDIKMPKVSGVEVLRQLKSHDKLKKIPIVIMTSSKEDKDIKEAYKLGVNSYVVKPLDFSEFIKVVTGLGFFWLIVNQSPNLND